MSHGRASPPLSLKLCVWMLSFVMLTAPAMAWASCDGTTISAGFLQAESDRIDILNNLTSKIPMVDMANDVGLPGNLTDCLSIMSMADLFGSLSITLPTCRAIMQAVMSKITASIGVGGHFGFSTFAGAGITGSIGASAGGAAGVPAGGGGCGLVAPTRLNWLS